MPKIDLLRATTSEEIEQARDFAEYAWNRLAKATEEYERLRSDEGASQEEVRVAGGDRRYAVWLFQDAYERLEAVRGDAEAGDEEPTGVVGSRRGLLRAAGRRKGYSSVVTAKFCGRRRHNSWKRHRSTQYRLV